VLGLCSERYLNHCSQSGSTALQLNACHTTADIVHTMLCLPRFYPAWHFAARDSRQACWSWWGWAGFWVALHALLVCVRLKLERSRYLEGCALKPWCCTSLSGTPLLRM
jgi:hypothetical protein